MVDIARRIGLTTAIDHRLTIDDEQKGVVIVRIVIGIAIIGFLVRDAFTDVFDDAGSLRNPLGGEDALAMNLGIADLNPRTGSHQGYRHAVSPGTMM